MFEPEEDGFYSSKAYAEAYINHMCVVLDIDPAGDLRFCYRFRSVDRQRLADLIAALSSEGFANGQAAHIDADEDIESGELYYHWAGAKTGRYDGERVIAESTRCNDKASAHDCEWNGMVLDDQQPQCAAH